MKCAFSSTLAFRLVILLHFWPHVPTMLSCDICGETVPSELDMKAHLIVHMENEVTCPFCKLSGVNYDEMCFHIETAHFEQNTPETNFGKLNAIQYKNPDSQNTTLQRTMEVHSSIHSACASNFPKNSAQSVPKDGTLQHEAFHTERITESRQYLRSPENQSGLSTVPGSIYETTYSPPDCPFCGKIEGCSQDMETHVKTKHASLLETPLEGKVFNSFKLL